MKSIIAAAGVAVLVSGCLGSKQIECGDEAAVSTFKSLMLEGIEDGVKADVQKGVGATGFAWDPAKARALISRLNVGVEDVRTIKKDPESTKRLCSASLIISGPSEMFENANKVRASVGYKDLLTFANSLDLKYEAGKTSQEVEYSAQPTDDGKKVFVESARNNKSIMFAVELVSGNLLKPLVEMAEANKAKETQEREARELQMKQEVETLEKEKINVSLQEENAAINAANAALNVIWNAASSDFRKKTLPEQRIWLKEREVDCKLKGDSLGAEVPAASREVIRLKCEVQMTEARSLALKDKIAALEAR